MCLKLCVLRMFWRTWTMFAAIEPTRSKTRSIPNDGVLESLLRIGLGMIFESILNGLGSEKTDENHVFFACFAIFHTIWSQLGTFVVEWFGRYVNVIFQSFLVALEAQKKCLKPFVLQGFCDLRLNAEVFGTSRCKNALEYVFNRFLARVGRAKSVKKHVFYKCLINYQRCLIGVYPSKVCKILQKKL